MSKKYVVPSKRKEVPEAEPNAVLSAQITDAFPSLGGTAVNKKGNAAPKINYRMSVIDGEEKKRQEELVKLQEEGWVMLTIPPPGTRHIIITPGLGVYKEEENTLRPQTYEHYDIDDIVVSADSYYDMEPVEEEEESDLE